MGHLLRPVAALLLGAAILLTGQGLQGTLVPVRASLESFATLSIGFIGGAYFLGFTVGCLKCGELIKRVGHVRVFLAMTALASAAPLVHGMLVSPLAWALLRALTGFCFAVLFVVIESWLNEQSTNESRGTVFSTYVMITLTVMAAGQMMTLLYDPSGFELFIIASVLVSLGALPVALSTSPSPEQPQMVDFDLRKLIRISPAGTVGCFGVGLANGAFWGMAPVFTAAVSDDTSLAAWFMTATVFGGAVSQWPIGYMSDRAGRRKTIIFSASLAAAVGVAILLLFDNLNFISANLLGMAWGAFAFPLYAVSVAHTNDYAEPEDYVLVSSGLLLMYGSGAILGPFIASGLMTLSGAQGLYGFAAIVHLVVVFYMASRLFVRSSAPADSQVEFRDALAAAHTASVIYSEEIQQQAEEEAEDASG